MKNIVGMKNRFRESVHCKTESSGSNGQSGEWFRLPEHMLPSNSDNEGSEPCFMTPTLKGCSEGSQ